MPTVSDRLNRAQQNHNAVITIIPFDEHAVDLSPTLKGPVSYTHLTLPTKRIV